MAADEMFIELQRNGIRHYLTRMRRRDQRLGECCSRMMSEESRIDWSSLPLSDEKADNTSLLVDTEKTIGIVREFLESL